MCVRPPIVCINCMVWCVQRDVATSRVFCSVDDVNVSSVCVRRCRVSGPRVIPHNMPVCTIDLADVVSKSSYA